MLHAARLALAYVLLREVKPSLGRCVDVKQGPGFVFDRDDFVLQGDHDRISPFKPDAGAFLERMARFGPPLRPLAAGHVPRREHQLQVIRGDSVVMGFDDGLDDVRRIRVESFGEAFRIELLQHSKIAVVGPLVLIPKGHGIEEFFAGRRAEADVPVLRFNADHLGRRAFVFVHQVVIWFDAQAQVERLQGSANRLAAAQA